MHTVQVRDLGRLAYADAFEVQQRVHEEVLSWRDVQGSDAGVLLVVEHPPVVTISKRASASANLIATPELLARSGVEIQPTDRGGDITYHGPGQLVVYPILDLNRLGLGLHEYMRLLEEAVIGTLARFGLHAERDSTATGVWVRSSDLRAGGQLAKIAAMGVRVRKWVSMHGLSLNVDPDMSHFGLIVPCGLAGRAVTSMKIELGDGCPSFAEVAQAVTRELTALIAERPMEPRRDIERSDLHSA